MITVSLPYKFTPRPYQETPWNEIMAENFRRGITVWPRRNGKDLFAWNIIIAKAAQRPALYYYIGPYYNQIRQIIWHGQDNTGRMFLDYIPHDLVKNMTKIDMRIELHNGSQIKLLGSDNIDSIVGTNPFGIVFTEFSLHRPDAWEYMRPILAANGGWALFNGTPRGRNHQYKLDMHARKDPGWFADFLTRDDTGIPSLEAIEEDRRSGMPEELIQQEYYCSYESGLVGSYYGDLLQGLEKQGRLRDVPWEPDLPVVTAWDLGIDDMTVIWSIQELNREIRFIDCYANHSKGLEHYTKMLSEKPYVYGRHLLPHDVSVRELSTGYSRRRTLSNLGLNNIRVVPKINLQDSISAIRTILPRAWFDHTRCFEGFEALKAYRREWDPKNQVFLKTPVHDGNSHFADALRSYGNTVLKHSGIDPSRLPRQATDVHDPLYIWNQKMLKRTEQFTDPSLYDPFGGRTSYGR